MTSDGRNANPQSIMDRLRALSDQQGVPLQTLITNYAIDRTLYRLGRTTHAASFILKGAQLLRQYAGQDFRSTMDADLLGPQQSDEGYLRQVLLDIAAVDGQDGLTYEQDTIRIRSMVGQTGHAAYRVSIVAKLGKSTATVRLDIGNGDAVVPDPVSVTLRPLLDYAPATLQGYAVETVIAEKLHAATALGATNTRLKDLYDLHFIAQQVQYDPTLVVDAIRATFNARNTPLTTARAGIPIDLCNDPANAKRWDAQYARIGQAAPLDLPSTCQAIEAAYGPLVEQAIEREHG